MSDSYPAGTVRALFATDLVTPPTRAALEARLSPPSAVSPQFLDTLSYDTLRAACRRLFPDCEALDIDLAFCLDERLARGEGNGWRYDTLPPDGEAARLGLRGLDESANALFGPPFHSLAHESQDSVLHAVQQGNAPGPVWQTLPPKRFFEELLAELSECYYSHPFAQEKIGYVGMADGRGWTRIGLNEREDWEPSLVPASSATPPPEDGERGQGQDSSQASHKAQPQNTIGASRTANPKMSRSHWPLSPSSGGGVADEAGTRDVDVVVIGTGAGGAPILARLAQAGLSVVGLEAGRRRDPAAFATDERAQDDLFWKDERLSAGGDPVGFGSNNSGIGVGGSTLHYTAYTPRPHPDDFRLYTEFGVGMDWPLEYDDLEPYLDELEQFLGVSGPASYPWGPPRRQGYPLAALPLNGAARLMQRACERMGIRTSPAPNAALSAPYYQPGAGWRRACTNRGFCQAGCSVGAKASMDVTFLPLAESHGAEIRPECFVTQLETDKSGAVTGVVYVQDGKVQRQRCRAVFLCAGAIESARLLLLNGLANGSGQVGRNFLAHTALQIWGRFDDDVRPYKGIPGGLISEDTHRSADADFAGGYLVQSIGVMPVTYASQMARGIGAWGAELDARMRDYNHTAGINICGECLPSPGNFLELSDEKDGRGLPKPRISFTNGENERRLTAHADQLMRAIWTEAGARGVWVFPRNAHTLGTCRMGANPATSVVDADGRCHDVPNLYVMDNSVYPSALSVNPALTQMALSLRTADRFLKRVRRGEAGQR